MREFQVNNLITLRLVDGKTILFVNNREFKQCKILLLNLPVKSGLTQEIKSIDDAAENLDASMEYENSDIIEPEQEFWGHCSNIQAWVENSYNTDLLHRSLAFPLLKILSEKGDTIAKQKLKEEIVRRYKYGNKNVQLYLYREGYFSYFKVTDFLSGVLSPEDFLFMGKVLAPLKDYRLIPYFDLIKMDKRGSELYYSIKNGMIKELELGIDSNLHQVPREIKGLKILERFHIYIRRRSNNIFGKEFKSESVKHLVIYCNVLSITIPDLLYYFPNLVDLEIVGFSSRPLVKLDESFKKLTHLKYLTLIHVNIEKLPDTIVNLKKLKQLTLRNTTLTSLSVSTIKSLRALEFLDLYGNSKLELSEEKIKDLKKTIRFFKYLDR
ncbi:hypothetical protein LCGC14_1164530 [marine sediment metagenome]|uniref:Leucine-rich repeat domain-containing protein n=1 Tax=marine sediment metagenome TaxID=412755 RepID=A0A0F9PX98_9ZZZZ|nr:MAG: leucine-rich repeat domain protein [Candidatus Lokiarchaeum sp. GC14_75]